MAKATPPETRNVIEKLLPGTGTDVKILPGGGKRTIGRIFFVPVLFDLDF